jgi:hypothetical protein
MSCATPAPTYVADMHLHFENAIVGTNWRLCFYMNMYWLNLASTNIPTSSGLRKDKASCFML